MLTKYHINTNPGLGIAKAFFNIIRLLFIFLYFISWTNCCHWRDVLQHARSGCFNLYNQQFLTITEVFWLNHHYYPKLTRAYTVRAGLFPCPAVLLFAPCASGTHRSGALQGTQTAAVWLFDLRQFDFGIFCVIVNGCAFSTPRSASLKMPDSGLRRRVSPCQFRAGCFCSTRPESILYKEPSALYGQRVLKY